MLRRILQEIFVLYDCLVYDDGITDPKPTGSWVKSGNGTVTISSTGTTVTASSNTTYRNTTLLTGDFEIILDADISGGAVRLGIQAPSSLNYAQTKAIFNELSNGKYRLKRVNGTFTAEYSSNGGVTWNNKSLETNDVGNNDCYFVIVVSTTGNERTITYKDLRIYPI